MTNNQSNAHNLGLPHAILILVRRWARHLDALSARIDARPWPRHHRLGSWQLMLVSPNKVAALSRGFNSSLAYSPTVKLPGGDVMTQDTGVEPKKQMKNPRKNRWGRSDLIFEYRVHG